MSAPASSSSSSSSSSASSSSTSDSTPCSQHYKNGRLQSCCLDRCRSILEQLYAYDSIIKGSFYRTPFHATHTTVAFQFAELKCFEMVEQNLKQGSYTVKRFYEDVQIIFQTHLRYLRLKLARWPDEDMVAQYQAEFERLFQLSFAPASSIRAESQTETTAASSTLTDVDVVMVDVNSRVGDIFVGPSPLVAYTDEFMQQRASSIERTEELSPTAPGRDVKDQVNDHLYNCEKIDWDDIELDKEVLGVGGYGVVHKGKRLSTGYTVAVKELHLPHQLDEISIKKHERALQLLVREMKTVQKLGGDERILWNYGYCFKQDERGVYRIRMITKWMENGSVHDYLKKARESNPPRIISMRDRVKLCLEAAEGIAFLHSKQVMVIHADIKPHNFLLDKDLNLCVSDFGLVNLSQSDISHSSSALHGACGTSPFMAPELLDPEAPAKPTAASDIFALAVTMWSICSDQQPYAGKNQQQVIASILQKKRLPFPSFFPAELQTLIERCWNQIPVYRGNCDQVVTQLESILNALTLGASSSSSSSAPAPEGVAPFLPIALEGEDVSRGSNTHAFSLSTNASREMRLAAYDDQEHPDRIEEDSYDAD